MEWAVFDYAGVISLPPPEDAAALLPEAVGVDPELFWPAYWDSREPYDRGAVDAAGFWGELCWRFGRTATSALLEQLVVLDLNAWLYLNRGTLDILTELTGRGVPLALLSNAPVEIARLIDEQPWAKLFRHRFFSADLQLAKPDPLIFQHVWERLGAAPGDLVFVDDRKENVDAAAALGIRSLLFTDAGRLRADLAPHFPEARSAGRRYAAR